MVSGSATVGIAVGIPCGVVLLVLGIMWSIFTKRNRDIDLEDPTELDADLTFENYRELAGVQSRKDYLNSNINVSGKDTNNNEDADSFDESADDSNNDNTRTELTKDTKPPKYRKYTHHSQQFSTNNINNNASLDDVSELNPPIAQSQFQISQEDLKRNSEKVFQDYFDGVIPMVVNPSDYHNDSPPSSNHSDAISVNNKDNGGRSSPKLLNFPYVNSSSLKLSSSNHSLLHHHGSSSTTINNNNSPLKNDSNNNSETHLLKSLAINLHSDASHDFMMPIPGSARTSMLVNNNSTSINRRVSNASHNTVTSSNSFTNTINQPPSDNHSLIAEVTNNTSIPNTPQKQQKQNLQQLPPFGVSKNAAVNVFATPPQNKASNHPYHEISFSNKKPSQHEDISENEDTTIIDSLNGNITSFSTSTSNNESESVSHSFDENVNHSSVNEKSTLEMPLTVSPTTRTDSSKVPDSGTNYSNTFGTNEEINEVNDDHSYSYHASGHDNGFSTPVRRTPDLKRQQSNTGSINNSSNHSEGNIDTFDFDYTPVKPIAGSQKNVFDTPTSQNGSFSTGVGVTPGNSNVDAIAADGETRRNPFDF